jgi:uncharacterized protein YuzE
MCGGYCGDNDRRQPVINRWLSDDIVLDIGEKERIIGIKIRDASEHLNLGQILPVQHEIVREAVPA